MNLQVMTWAVAGSLAVTLAALAWLAHRRAGALAADLSRLRRECGAMVQHQLAIVREHQRLQAEQGTLLERLARIDARPTTGRRIENAMHVARHGAANEAVLRELGLSEAEAALLMRMNGLESAPEAPAGPAATRTGPPGPTRRRSEQAQQLAAALAVGG